MDHLQALFEPYYLKDSTPYGQDLKWLFYKDEYNNVYLQDVENKTVEKVTHYPFSRYAGRYQIDFQISGSRATEYIAKEYFDNYVLDEEYDVEDDEES